MSNLERARKGERLKVEYDGERLCLKPVRGDIEFYIELNDNQSRWMEGWINKQIDAAVTHAIDDTPDPVYWRDLDREKLQKGDRVLDLSNRVWLVVGKDRNAPPEGIVMEDWPAQRPAKINGESED